MFLFYHKHIVYPGYREFVSLEEASQWGQKYFGDWLPKYQETGSELHIGNDPCIRALLMYLGHNYIAINNELREYFYLQNMYIDDASRKYRRAEALKIEQVISRSKIPENVILYRFINDMQYMKHMLLQGENQMRVGAMLVDKGFMSTSLVYSALKEEHDGVVLLRLLCPAGLPGAYVNLLSRRHNEQEVLLPPNSKFKILNIYKNRDHKIVFDCLLKNSRNRL